MSARMNWKRQKRQILLFAGPILIPAIVLVGQAIRVLRADAEISQKRIVEERRNEFDRLRRQLSDRLEAIKLQEIDRRIRPSDVRAAQPAKTGNDAAIVLVSPIEQDHLVLPWSVENKAIEPSPRFSSYLTNGESAEFVAKDFSAAADKYRQAIGLAQAPAEECDARLHLGRVLVHARLMSEAKAAYGAILQQCGAVVDQDGIPYRMYAVECLLKAGLESASDRQIVIDSGNSPSWLPPLQLYQVRSLL